MSGTRFSGTALKSLRRFFAKGKRAQTYLGVCITAFVLVLQLASPPALQTVIDRLEYLVYDQRMALTPLAEKPPENRIVIVDLDERSLQAEGQYPWNRIKVGQLTEKLRDAGVLVVGFDITFPEPDRSVRDLLAPVDLDSLDPAFSATLREIEPQINADQYFARAMQSGIDVVLAINFTPRSDNSYNKLPRSLFDIDPAHADRVTVSDMTGFTGNIDILQEAAYGNGSMNQQPDADGVVRRVPLVIRFGSQLFPTLSLEMLRVYQFLESYELLTARYGDVDVVTGVQVGEGAGSFTISTNGFGQVLVPYVGPSSLGMAEPLFPYISATDLLRDTLSDEERELLQNALVLVGTSAPGLGDLRATPLQRVFPGVEVHANLLNGLLSAVNTTIAEVDGGVADTQSLLSGFSNNAPVVFPYRPDWADGALFLSILVLGLGMALVFPYLGAASMTALTVALLIGSVWLNFLLWSNYKLDFPLVLIVLLIVLVSALDLIYGFFAESQTRRMIKGMFDQYVPPAHIDTMLEDPDNFGFEGESKQMSVLFSDIRSFTTISESLTAVQLKKLLNEYFTPITGIIFEHQGTIDKYVGDMVMAFWGAPLDDPDHRANAVRAGLRMLEATETLKQEFLEQGLPEVNVGVGINTGLMNVGDMGSTYRRSYTVLGDAVNLGSRLEGLTKFYGISLLIGEETAKGLEGFLLRMIDKVKVKGKDEAITCYEPMCEIGDASEQLKQRVDAYHDALAHYFAQRWDEAEQALEALLAEEPSCVLYQVYLERIADLRGQQLPGDWDGSFTHTSK